ncbi:MAG: Smr/MutS family protein [Gemmatimonadota bacterium]
MTALATDGEADGVQAQEGAGTPSPFSPAFVDHATEALEFGAALEVVAGHAAGPVARERLLARRPSTDPGWIRTELEAVRQTLALLDRGEAIEVPPVPSLRDELARLRVGGSVLASAELTPIKRTLQAARVVRAELERLAAELDAAAALLVELPPRELERRLTAAVNDEGELLDTASPRLFEARREIHTARERLLKKLDTLLRSLDPQTVPGGAQVTVRGDRYVIPVRRDSRSRPDGIIHDESATHGTLFIEPSGAVELGNALRTAIAEAEREALRVLRDLTELARPELSKIRAAHDMCVAADELLARAKYARQVGGHAPALSEGEGELVLRRARHPLLIARGVPVVPFDLALTRAERTLVVSGPNAGGKTVLLKTIGLAVLMVQAGLVPPLGAESRLPVFRAAFADIGDHQSLAADLSTFSAHLSVMRRVLDGADAASLVLIDEMGSGTDPAEGAALAGAVLRALTERGTRTVATTHLGALKLLAAEVPGVVNGSLRFDVDTVAPTFEFLQGVPGRSYGLAIARRLGIDPAVLARAEAELPERERALEQMLAAAEARERVVESRAAALEARAELIENREARAAVHDADLGARETEISRRERDAERAGKRSAKEHLLRAREQVEEAIRLAQGGADAEAARTARRTLESAVRDVSSELAADEEEPAPVGTGGAVAVGVRVRLTNGTKGRVVELRPDGKVVVGAGAVKMVVAAAGLEVLAEHAEPAARRRAAPIASAADDSSAALEIDLRGMRGDEAETATLSALDAAVLADNPFLRIIHGMGTGVVRERVRGILKRDRRIAKFDFAPRNQGGTGVTVAEFKDA